MTYKKLAIYFFGLFETKDSGIMATRNLHDHPFDEGTITKLGIFENYIGEWLPVFVMTPYGKELWIFDFFAGTGQDINGVAGTPIRILQQVKKQAGNIFKKECKINICFNEFDKNKFDFMKSYCEQFMENDDELKRLKNNQFLFLHYYNCDFAELFSEKLEIIKVHPSLLLLDQNGMKFTAEKYLSDLEKLSHTDFLYFLSSSYFYRFGETQAFQTNLKIDMEKVKASPYKYVHKSILEQLRSRFQTLKLYPFTIKKGTNIYGIIFGSKHPLAVDKFLKTAWKENKINGEANFDIDEDTEKCQMTLFGDEPLTKIEAFKKELRQNILAGKLKNNKDVYDFTLEHGHLPSHASDELKEMKKEGWIIFEGKSPLINYEQIYKNKKIVTFQIIKK